MTATATLPIITETSAMAPVLDAMKELYAREKAGDEDAAQLNKQIMALYGADKAVVIETSVRRNGQAVIVLTIKPSAELLRRLGLRKAAT